MVEAFSRLERPWTRAEINRARIIATQFGSVILALFRSPAALAAELSWYSSLDPHLLRERQGRAHAHRPSVWTEIGPSKGSLPVTRRTAPGRMPRESR